MNAHTRATKNKSFRYVSAESVLKRKSTNGWQYPKRLQVSAAKKGQAQLLDRACYMHCG